MPVRRAFPLAAMLPLLLAGCSGGGDSGPSPSCTITYSGGANESVWCDAPAVRSTGGAGYALWVMAFRGGGASADQAGQLTLSFAGRPQVGVDYGFGGAPQAVAGFAERTVASQTTHEAYSVGEVGAVTVRFSQLPPTDGADPTGLGGIGTVHGTISATLVPVTGTGPDVTVQGTF